jgi:hypothetical protein
MSGTSVLHPIQKRIPAMPKDSIKAAVSKSLTGPVPGLIQGAPFTNLPPLLSIIAIASLKSLFSFASEFSRIYNANTMLRIPVV